MRKIGMAFLAIASAITTDLITLRAYDEGNVARVENGLLLPISAAGETRPMSLQSRMDHYTISAVSIAVIKGNSIAWSKAWGHRDPELQEPANEESLFRAGSLTKPVIAALTLKLAEKGRLDLDADIDTLLSSWEIPASEFNTDSGPTARQLISHTAGFNVHGFGEYMQGAEIPSLVQILNGSQPAQSNPIELIQAPGTGWKYSGGGYQVLQQVLEDATGSSLKKLVEEHIFKPLNLKHSDLATIMPESRRENAVVGRYNGGIVPGQFASLPELAAAGLFTTPTDYARFCIEVMKARQGKENSLFSQATAKQFISDNLGIFSRETQGKLSFYHGGVTALYEAYVYCYPESGDGVVIMINGNCGGKLVNEILRSIAATYGWPDHHPVEKSVVKVGDEQLRAYEGTYDVNGKWNFTIKAGEGILNFYFGDSAEATPLYPESESTFFDPNDGTILTFQADASRVTILNSRGKETDALKVAEQ